MIHRVGFQASWADSEGCPTNAYQGRSEQDKHQNEKLDVITMQYSTGANVRSSRDVDGSS